MEISTAAAAKYTTSIQINAPITVVWQLLSDINKWPQWNPEVKTAHLNGALAPETDFTWKAGPGTITSHLVEVKAPTNIAWTGKTMGISATHIYKLEEAGSNKTIVTTAETFDGIVVKIMKSYFQKTLAKSLDGGLASLKKAAEQAQLNS